MLHLLLSTIYYFMPYLYLFLIVQFYPLTLLLGFHSNIFLSRDFVNLIGNFLLESIRIVFYCFLIDCEVRVIDSWFDHWVSFGIIDYFLIGWFRLRLHFLYCWVIVQPFSELLEFGNQVTLLILRLLSFCYPRWLFLPSFIFFFLRIS